MEVAASLGLGDDLSEPYGRYRAKISLDALADAKPSGKQGPSGPRQSGKQGRYILVSAVTPTAAGEGKTVTSIGLTMGLATLGQDRKSTRLNSSHEWISYAVFCLKK